MSNHLNDPFLPTLWKSIDRRFFKWKWRVFAFFYALSAILFYVWIFNGTNFPAAATFLSWVAPILVGFILKIFVDTHIAISKFIEPKYVSSKECDRLLFARLERVARWKHSTGRPISIDVLGVGLHHSHEWIENDLKEFMKDHPNVFIELRIAFVDPSVLEKFSFNKRQIDWATECHERVEWVKNKIHPYAFSCNGHLRIYVRTIKNLPHWHGIMVERKYLFMGTVSWNDGTERFFNSPKTLTCASNGYRVFAPGDRQDGEERVSLFRRWLAHYLYGNHEGEIIVDTISNFYNNELPIVLPMNKNI